VERVVPWHAVAQGGSTRWQRNPQAPSEFTDPVRDLPRADFAASPIALTSSSATADRPGEADPPTRVCAITAGGTRCPQRVDKPNATLQLSFLTRRMSRMIYCASSDWSEHRPRKHSGPIQLNRASQFPRKRRDFVDQIRLVSVLRDPVDNCAANNDCVGVTRDFASLLGV
jgi:hypothetical protein